MPKKKKSVQKISHKDTPVKDLYTGVLLEKMNDNILLLVEGHEVLEKGQERIEGDLKKMQIGHDDLRGDVIKLRQNSDGLRKEFEELRKESKELRKEFNAFVIDTKSSFQSVFNYLKHIDEEIKSNWEKRLQILENIVLHRQ